MKLRAILFTILLGLLPLQAAAVTITGKVLGPYANAVVCIDNDGDLYCDSDFVESDATGAFRSAWRTWARPSWACLALR